MAEIMKSPLASWEPPRIEEVLEPGAIEYARDDVAIAEAYSIVAKKAADSFSGRLDATSLTQGEVYKFRFDCTDIEHLIPQFPTSQLELEFIGYAALTGFEDAADKMDDVAEVLDSFDTPNIFADYDEEEPRLAVISISFPVD